MGNQQSAENNETEEKELGMTQRAEKNSFFCGSVQPSFGNTCSGVGNVCCANEPNKPIDPGEVIGIPKAYGLKTMRKNVLNGETPIWAETPQKNNQSSLYYDGNRNDFDTVGLTNYNKSVTN
jgi:hypothetical protein